MMNDETLGEIEHILIEKVCKLLLFNKNDELLCLKTYNKRKQELKKIIYHIDKLIK